MSPSPSKSRLRIRGGEPTLEIEVLDSNFESVAAGVKDLNVSLEPGGLYEIRFREGSEQESRLLKADPGLHELKPPRFEPASPAPVERTSTSREQHQDPVLRATRAIGRASAARSRQTGGVIVMVRNVRGQARLRFPTDLPQQLSLVDRDLSPLDPDGEAWQSERKAGWALWSSAVAPGGYALRIADHRHGSDVLYQSLWVDKSWQTMVFIPNTKTGPAPELATVHIAQVGHWSPRGQGSKLAVALESVLDGLRGGRSVVPDHLGQLLGAKFTNPFLGIAAGHALLLDPQPSLELLSTVVENLKRLIPANPDVIALGHRARNAGANVRTKSGVGWPPMMYGGYRALLRADANKPGVVKDGSPAEDIAAHLRLTGLWTTWAESPPSRKRPARSRSITIGGAAETDAATERVLAYVEGAATVNRVATDDILRTRSLKQLAIATGLPSTAVENAVTNLRGDFE